MCAILGTVSIPICEKEFGALLSIVAHRGPDASGTYEANGANGLVRLGHRRLSIIDLSSGANQPFEKGDYVLVFNGEIYNYRELRAELRQRGAAFTTTSDTEVILEAWRAWGHESLRRLRGMFAFALYRKSDGHLVLARDPFGIKPLYILRKRNGLAFASELKALVPILGARATLDNGAILASLVYGWLPDDYCIYRGVSKLSAGAWIEVTGAGIAREKFYWDERQELITEPPDPVSVEQLRHIIEESVRLHMVADVPVSTFLSGGLDSSIVTVLAQRHTTHLESYTTHYRREDQAMEAMPDDLRYARLLASQHGIKLNEIELRPNLLDLLPQLVYALDEPLADGAVMNVHAICQAAHAQGTKVLLSGMGADEIFGGYRRHYACDLARRYRKLPPWLRHHVIRRVVNALPVASGSRGYRTVRWARRFLSFAELDEEAAYRRSYSFYDRNELFAALGRNMEAEIEELVERHVVAYSDGPPDDQVNRMCFVDLRYFLRGLNLFYTDRISMAASTEVRVPFVDIEVVKAAFSLSGRTKLRGSTGKLILKKAAEVWLPKEIVYRPKANFAAPLRSWLRGELRVLVDDSLPQGEIVKRGFLSSSHVRRIIDDDRQGRQDYSREIFRLLVLDTWLKACSVPRAPSDRFSSSLA